MRTLRSLDFNSLPPETLRTMESRQAARAVVFDETGRIALLYVQKGGYYKLPGGGVEVGEDLITAVKRECVEEIGCEIEVDQEIGMTIDYHAPKNRRQESYCYLAHLVGAKGTPNLSEGEAADGFVTVWLPLTEAIQRVAEVNTEEQQGKFVTPRELLILKEVEKMIG